MKKKLFLLGTCFLLLSSIVVFFVYRNVQPSEKKITNEIPADSKDNKDPVSNEKEKPEENSHQEEGKKPEENSHQEEKNNRSEDKQEEIDDLPWVYTRIGTVLSSVISAIGFLIFKIFFGTRITIYFFAPQAEDNENEEQRQQRETRAIKDGSPIVLSFSRAIFLLIRLIFFPLIFAMRKYKDKSYWKRFWFVNFSSLGKKIFNGILILFALESILRPLWLLYQLLETRKKEKNS